MTEKRLPLIFYPRSAQSVYRFGSDHPSRHAVLSALSSLQVKEGEMINISLTSTELSVVLPDRLASHIGSVGSTPENPIRKDTGWALFRVANPPDGVDFSVVGVMADISSTCATAGVSLLALSTYDTDWIMIKKDKYQAAMAALRGAGWSISEA